MKIIGIIPARYASTRFPGKPLVNISGKSMIRRVYDQACQAASLSEVWVATDDDRIFAHMSEHGGRVLMTSPNHTTGTERCNEAVCILSGQDKTFDIAINIQGDEPFIAPSQIDRVAACFSRSEVEIATLIKSVTSSEELFNPSIIKVTKDQSGRAICFSRAAIPFCRGREQNEWLAAHTYYKHIGIYAYRTGVLSKIVQLPPSPVEQAESLEQLRWMENGYRIYVEITELESHSIDTPEDLKRIN